MSRWSKYWLLVFAASMSLCGACPTDCTCRETVTQNMVDLNVACDGNGSKTIPDDLPLNTTYLTLTGYKLPVLDLRLVGGFKKLRGLKLPSNEIAQIEGTLEVFPHLFEVYLSKNKLTSVSPRTFGNATKRLEYVDLSENPFDCNAQCGGLPLNTGLCDCSVDTFNCTCNIKWLKEQVKQSPSGWVGVRCQVPKDTDIQNVDIEDYWCKTKWRWLLAIIFICPLVFYVGIGLVATVVYKCKKMNSSRYALLGRNTDLVTENQLNILAGKLGMEWEHVAIHLGMTKADVDRFIRDNERDMRGQAFNMLITWKNNNGERATIAALIEQLKSFKLDLEKYRFLEESSDSN